MDKMLFKKAQHIISPYLNKETRVMDLMCGENFYAKWIKRENIAHLIPLSPSEMEHISHENPFVAYNNFVNDDRKVPTDHSKADVVLLLGPLYDKQSEENKRETLKEIKKLVSQDGKVITLRSSGTSKKGNNSLFEQEKDNLDDAGFSVKEQQSINENDGLSLAESPYTGYEYYLTVATPKPVISCDALPPKVYVRTPVDVIQKYNITVLDEGKNEDNNVENVTQERCYHSQIKESINPSLQRKPGLRKSIDSTLYVTEKSKDDKVISFDLPILPKEITEQYNNSKKENNKGLSNDNSKKEINTEDNQNNISNEELLNETIKNNNSKEEIFNKLADIDDSKEEVTEKNLWDIPPLPHIPIKPSIDKNLYVRKRNNDSSVRNNEKIDCKKVQQSIDKSLQIRISKIDPKYAKPKSKKKCIRNILR